MPSPSPHPITTVQRRARQSRIVRLARELGFVGRVEYRHVYSQTGGAQYGRGSSPEEDLLTIYAEAFERDADTNDFSLATIVAHERGPQLLARHPRIAKRVAGRISTASEEILASLLAATICRAETDRDALVAKATVELLNHGESIEVATRRTVEPVGGTVMIGSKKLSTIRQELKLALTATGDDPIRWLEERMTAPERQSSATAGESEVLNSLRRYLNRKRRLPRLATKRKK